MFDGCKNLESIKIGDNFNTGNVKNMSHMFCDCNNLKDLDVLSKFDTKNVTDMSLMFKGCSSLESIKFENSFNTGNVTNMSGMFSWCTILNKLDVSKFITNEVRNMSYMFFKCSNLINLDLSSFDTKNVTNMYGMFAECSKLNSINLSSFIFQNNLKMTKMFFKCENLNNLIFGKDFKDEDAKGPLVERIIREFNLIEKTSFEKVFFGCAKLGEKVEEKNRNINVFGNLLHPSKTTWSNYKEIFTIFLAVNNAEEAYESAIMKKLQELGKQGKSQNNIIFNFDYDINNNNDILNIRRDSQNNGVGSSNNVNSPKKEKNCFQSCCEYFFG